MAHVNTVIKLGQQCLQSMPVLILGSGASAAHGIRGMIGLQNYLIDHVIPKSDEELTQWKTFQESLEVTRDLERTLQVVTLTRELTQQIVELTRRMIVEDEAEVFWKIVKGTDTLPLTNLFKYLLRSTHPKISVVTPNYDRLAEYAADAAHVQFHTGFSNGYYRYFDNARLAELPRPTGRPVPDKRTVEVWKVHGSVDWFANHNQEPIALPCELVTAPEHQPLIVTPGLQKYAITHQEPFRTIMSCADRALSEARGFLCIGYGFNDDHIEPKLVSRVTSHEVPIVILSRTLRDSSKALLKRCTHAKILALEKDGEGTRAYFQGESEGVKISEPDLWSLGRFLTATIG